MLKRRDLHRIAKKLGYKFEAIGYTPASYGDDEYWISSFTNESVFIREEDMFEDEDHVVDYLKSFTSEIRDFKLMVINDELEPQAIGFYNGVRELFHEEMNYHKYPNNKFAQEYKKRLENRRKEKEESLKPKSKFFNIFKRIFSR